MSHHVNGVDIVALYETGYSVREVARRAGLSETTARRRLRAARVVMRPPGAGAPLIPAETCTICGRPLENHPRCAQCGILMGPGHEEQGAGSRCVGCRGPLVLAHIPASLLQAISRVEVRA